MTGQIVVSKGNRKVRIDFGTDHWFGFRHVIFEVFIGMNVQVGRKTSANIQVEELSAYRQQLKPFQCREDQLRTNKHPGKFQSVRSRLSIHKWAGKT